jgi:DNA-binding transcriptional ArsR family regulator
MERKIAPLMFAALSQETRIEVVRLLVRAGSKGVASGQIGAVLGVKPSTMSSNLSILVSAGLIRSEREGRRILYFADFDGLRALLGFLTEDCCGGAPEVCRSLLDTIVCR